MTQRVLVHVSNALGYARRGQADVICAVALLLLATAAHAQPDSRTFEHQGTAREYILVNAAIATSRPRPLLMVLHGRRDAQAPNRSSVPLDQLARREDIVLAYSAGIAGVWNWPTRQGSAESPLSRASGEVTDDIGFLVRLMDFLIAKRIADPTRIYVSGTSMGGFMTFSLICDSYHHVAAAAALIATMTHDQLKACEPKRAVPVMMLAGTRDELIPYEGRTGLTGRLLSIQDTLLFWSELHGCKSLNGTALTKGAPSGSISTIRLDATGCKINRAVRLYRVEGGGHTLPSLLPQGEAELKRFGPRSTEFETSEEVWNYLKGFRL